MANVIILSQTHIAIADALIHPPMSIAAMYKICPICPCPYIYVNRPLANFPFPSYSAGTCVQFARAHALSHTQLQHLTGAGTVFFVPLLPSSEEGVIQVVGERRLPKEIRFAVSYGPAGRTPASSSPPLPPPLDDLWSDGRRARAPTHSEHRH